MRLEEFILFLHSTIFAFEETTEELMGAAKGAVINRARTKFAEYFDTASVFKDLKADIGEKQTFDQKIETLRKYFNSDRDIFDKVIITKTGNEITFELKECFLAKTGIHDVLKTKSGICPMALVFASLISEYGTVHVDNSEFNDNGTVTKIKIDLAK